MSETVTQAEPAAKPGLSPALLSLLALGVILWAPVVSTLWGVWETDKSLSHGSLIVLVALALLWMRRSEFRGWDQADPGGLAILILGGLVHLASVWADIEFLKPFSLILVTAGGFYYLGGKTAFQICIGPLGFLFFMIPWPTTVVESLAFPLQLTSSSYAALLAGMCGLPIQREGVHLAVVPDLNAKPIYSILVARECSGLTSLMVLLAVAYLIAYHTPANLGWRGFLLASVVPIALLCNALRLTLVLVAGTYHSAQMATWVHDNEAPVLVFLCSLGLLLIRYAIVTWTQTNDQARAWHYGRVPAFYR